MGKVYEARKVVDDFKEFIAQFDNREHDAIYYYWVTEAILKAAESIKEIEER